LGCFAKPCYLIGIFYGDNTFLENTQFFISEICES
jgi:hypothetical protein